MTTVLSGTTAAVVSNNSMLYCGTPRRHRDTASDALPCRLGRGKCGCRAPVTPATSVLAGNAPGWAIMVRNILRQHASQASLIPMYSAYRDTLRNGQRDVGAARWYSGIGITGGDVGPARDLVGQDAGDSVDRQQIAVRTGRGVFVVMEVTGQAAVDAMPPVSVIGMSAEGWGQCRKSRHSPACQRNKNSTQPPRGLGRRRDSVTTEPQRERHTPTEPQWR